MTSIPLKVTDTAWTQLEKLMADEPAGSFFRVTIESGGCAGLQYKFAFDAVQQPDDHVLQQGETKVVIDETSLPFLTDSQLDYVAEMMGASFQITNPNASSNCGCGSSFSV